MYLQNSKKYLLLSLMLFILLISSCKNQINKFPKGNVYEKNVWFQFAIYLSDDPKIDFKKDVQNIITKKTMNISIVNEPAKKITKPQLTINIPDKIESYNPPNIEYLQYTSRGIEEKEFRKISNSKFAVIFDFYANQKNSIETMKNAYEIIYILAKEKNGYIWDELTRECFSAEYWNEVRYEDMKNETINIEKHITIHFYKSGDYYREITLGMQKFGLPDVLVNDISALVSDSIGYLINLSCQTLLENGKVEKDGKLKLNIDEIKNIEYKDNLLKSLKENAKKKVEVDIIKGKNEEGDPDNRLLEIYFHNKIGENKQIEQSKIISELFGSEDKIVNVDHDKRLLDASNRAKEKLPYLKEIFKKGLEPGEYILVKLPFKTDERGNEWMWVEISDWGKNTIKGILQNDPYYIKDLKSGSLVEGNENDVFDYIHHFPDGSEEGNETGKIIEESNK